MKVALGEVAGAGVDARGPGVAMRTATSGPYSTPDARGIGDAIARAIAGATGQSSAPRVLECVGICAPGLVNEETGVIAASMNLPGLVGVDLRGFVLGALEAALGVGAGRAVRVAFLPDAHAAALDDWTCRVTGNGSDNTIEPPERLLAISLGTGVGACVIDREARGTSGDGARGDDAGGGAICWLARRVMVTGVSSGHLGQIDVGCDEADPKDPTGRRTLPRPVGSDGGIGSLESYIGLAALRARYGDDLAAGLAGEAIDRGPLRALTQALRIAHAIYRPNVISLLGGVGLALLPRVAEIHGAVSRGLTRLARPGWRLETGKDLFHAARGAARAAAGGLNG